MKEGTGRLAVALAFALALTGASFLGPPDAAAVLAELADDAYTAAGAPGTFGVSKILRIQRPPAAGSVQKAFVKFEAHSPVA